jgi:hypothetical protein
MSKQDNGGHEEYEGTGKFNSMLGRGATEGVTAGVIGTAVGAGVGALLKRPAVGAGIGAGLGLAVGGAHGAVKGYQSGRDGKAQHEGNLDMIEQLRAENAGLRAQMGPVEHVETMEKPVKTPGQEEAKEKVPGGR